MWKKTTGWLFEVQKRNGILEEKDRRLYEYAYGVLLGRVAIYLITVILGIATGNWLEMLVFLLPFTVLRQYAGGIHLEKAGSCMIVSSILVLLCSQYLASDLIVTWQMRIIWLVAVGFIFAMAPVDGIDILGCALGGLSTWKLGNVAESYTTSMAGGGNRVISGIIGMVPVTFIVNTNVDRNDIDHPLHLYHRIELTFSTGRLCLVNTHGPVIWLPFLHMPRDEYGTLSINVEEEVNIPSGVTIGNVMLPSVKETFEQIWPDAVKKALEILFKQNRTEKMSMAQYQIYVSKLWSEICQKVGYMNIVDYDNFGDIKNIFYDLEKRHLIKKENDGIE